MREDLLETKGCVCFRLDPPHKNHDSRPFGFLEKRRAAQMFIPLNPPKADLLLRGPEASCGTEVASELRPVAQSRWIPATSRQPACFLLVFVRIGWFPLLPTMQVNGIHCVFNGS